MMQEYDAVHIILLCIYMFAERGSVMMPLVSTVQMAVVPYMFNAMVLKCINTQNKSTHPRHSLLQTAQSRTYNHKIILHTRTNIANTIEEE